MIGKLFANWRFRTDTPGFRPGEEIRAYLTGFDAESGLGRARIGDTVLEVSGADAGQVDRLLDLRVESFDETRCTGRAAVRTKHA